ncbi:MAG: hypothetical protein Q9227_006583 [Pyrenula ochraceoflavens]
MDAIRVDHIIEKGSRKKIAERPLADAVKDLNLPLHEINTFTGWSPPKFQEPPYDANLVITVSFGLFVPPRILKGARFGGLNVHPSLLPEFTGVTLQTLHSEKIDHGIVLKQTPSPGFEVPPPPSFNPLEVVQPDPQYATLFQRIQEESSKMLVDGIRNRVYLPPLSEVGWSKAPSEEENLRRAPKIQDEDAHIDWATWTADDIHLRQRILGNVWSRATPVGSERTDNSSIRLKFTRPMPIADQPWVKPCLQMPPGCPYFAAHRSLSRMIGYDSALVVNTCDGKILNIKEMIPENEGPQNPMGPSIRLDLIEETSLKGRNGRKEWTFWKYIEPLH